MSVSKFPAAIGISNPKSGHQKLRVAVPDDVAESIRVHAATDDPKFRLVAITEAEVLFKIHDPSEYPKKVSGVSSMSVAPACLFPNQIVVACDVARLFPDGFRFDPMRPVTLTLFGDTLTVEVPAPERRSRAALRGKVAQGVDTTVKRAGKAKKVRKPAPPKPATVLFLTEQGGTFDVPQDVAKLVFNLLNPFKRKE